MRYKLAPKNIGFVAIRVSDKLENDRWLVARNDSLSPSQGVQLSSLYVELDKRNFLKAKNLGEMIDGCGFNAQNLPAGSRDILNGTPGSWWKAPILAAEISRHKTILGTTRQNLLERSRESTHIRWYSPSANKASEPSASFPTTQSSHQNRDALHAHRIAAFEMRTRAMLSSPTPNTIGIVAVAALAAIVAGKLPGVAMAATRRRTTVSHQCQCRQAIVLAFKPVVLNRHVLTLDVTGFAKPFAERAHTIR
jgi:hypothetical protein